MGLFERIRGEGNAERTDGNGAGLVDRIGSLARRGGALVDRVADGVKDVASRGLLKDAAEAHARGNLGAAFYLAKEASEADPGDVASDGLFWDLALAFEQPEAARQSAANLVAHHVGCGAPELAAQFFAELVASCGAPPIDASVLVRVVPELVARLERAEAAAADASKPDEESPADDPALHRGALVAALRLCVDPRNEALSPGLAMRVAELARPYDRGVALEAARRALAAQDIHEAKRAKLVALVRELDPEADLPEAAIGAADPLAIDAETADVSDVTLLEADELGVDDLGTDELEADLLEDEALCVAAAPAPPTPAATAPADPVVSVSEAEAERLTAMLEPAEEELEAVAIADRSEAEVLPELMPIDDSDPARNHPQRIESPIHHELSEDEVDRMRARIERALTARDAAAAEAAGSNVDGATAAQVSGVEVDGSAAKPG
jgi:hypothetical protein